MSGCPVPREAAVTGAPLLVLALTAALGLAACGGSASRPPSGWQAPDPQAAAVTIQTFEFRPVPLVVKAGTRVTWTNTDGIEHTVTSGTPEGRDGRFNAPLEGKGATFAFTFTQAGSYPYFCDRHNHMRGEIRVTPERRMQ